MRIFWVLLLNPQSAIPNPQLIFMSQKTFKYSNGEVTVAWKPDLCIHSKNCWKGLIQVFNPAERPWIKMDGASSERIIEQVKKCPSGALSYFMNSEETDKTDT